MPVSLAVLGLLVATIAGLTFLVGREPSRADVRVRGDEVVIRLPLPTALLALRRELRLPAATIVDVRVAPVRGLVRGMRVGTALPGWLAAGTWHHRHGRDFVDTRRGGPALVIDARGRYTRVVLEVANPHAAADTLKQALSAPR